MRRKKQRWHIEMNLTHALYDLVARFLRRRPKRSNNQFEIQKRKKNNYTSAALNGRGTCLTNRANQERRVISDFIYIYIYISVSALYFCCEWHALTIVAHFIIICTYTFILIILLMNRAKKTGSTDEK